MARLAPCAVEIVQTCLTALPQAVTASIPVMSGWLPIHHIWYRCLWNKHSSRCRWCFQCPDPAPLISKLTPRYPTAANINECSFHRPVALTLPMSVNIDIRGEGGSPTLTTSRMNVYFTDTNNNHSIRFNFQSLLLSPTPWYIYREREIERYTYTYIH